jgi:hypothetical protein
MSNTNVSFPSNALIVVEYDNFLLSVHMQKEKIVTIKKNISP